jgi:hypothetical protein
MADLRMASLVGLAIQSMTFFSLSPATKSQYKLWVAGYVSKSSFEQGLVDRLIMQC